MSQYVFDHGFDLERERLGKLEEWLDPGTIRYIDQIGVQAGWRVLEVAAGAGSIARVLSDRVGPNGSVMATDLSLKFLEELALPNVEVRKHDIVNESMEEDTYDLVHVRLLLMHLPQRDEVLKKLVAAARPGGIVFIEDMEFLTWTDITPSPAMARVREAMVKIFNMASADPFYGRNLPFLLDGAGLEDVWAEGRVAWHYRWNNPGLKNFALTLVEIREFFLNTGLVSAEDLDEAIHLLDDSSWQGVPPMIVAAYGRKPA